MIALALALALFACSEPAADAWREHPEFVRGGRAFEAQRWDEAARAFEAAYADHPRPELLWAQAQALRFGGRCQEALPLYERFIATDPTDEEITDANTNIAACRELVGEQAEVVPVEPAPPSESVAEPSPSPPPPPASTLQPPDRNIATHVQPRVSRDAWGHGLLWSGVGVAGIGAGLLAAGHAQRVDARGASTELEYQRTFAGAPALGKAGIAVLVTGAALITAGIVRFAVVGARRSNRTMARLPIGVMRW
jgi:tetratricopeptide (TPR) repeat protein